jgi:uracil-DNA glycosylase family 4
LTILDSDTHVRGPECHLNGVRGYGAVDAKVMLIGISPGSEETRTGIPMSGTSGKLTDNILLACGWHRDKCYATNIVCYATGAPTFPQIIECWPRLQDEVAQFEPDLCVLLGNPVTSVFFPNRTPGQVRGAFEYYEPWRTYLLPTYHPAAILHTNSEFITRDIVRDFAKIPDFMGGKPDPTVNFTTLHTLEQAQRVLDTLPRNTPISIDLESPLKEDDPTSNIDDPIKCFAISYIRDGQEHNYWFTGDATHARALQWPIDREWGGQNFGSYDSIQLYQHMGVLLPIKWDTIYLSYCRDERGGVHALKPNAREYELAGHYEDYPDEKQIKMPKGVKRDSKAGHAHLWNVKLSNDEWTSQYNTKDAAYANRLRMRHEPKVRADGMWPVYEQLLQAASVYRQMQLHGVYVNPMHFHSLMKEWVPQLDVKEKALQQQIASLGGNPNINVGSDDQIADFLFNVLRLPASKYGKKRPSVDAEVLEALEDEHEFIGDLLDLGHMEKAVNTYLVGTHEHVKAGSLVHPAPKLYGVVSNRLAYNNPAINTTPKVYNENPYLQRIRWIYTARDEDHVLLEFDYRQAEVYMAWQYSQDPTMWADLQSGDFHRKSAAFIFGLGEVDVSLLKKLITAEQRSDAKRITFGKFFLIGADKMARQSNREKRRDAKRNGTPFTNPMTPLLASRFIGAWDRRYPYYGKYVDRMFNDARTKGELVSLDGRKRRYPIVLDDSIKTQVANWPIQTTAHACLMSSIIEMFPILTSKYDAWPLIDVHDAVLVEARKDNWRDVAKEVMAIMSKPRYPGVIGLPVECKMGYSWYDLEEVEIAA